MGTFKKWEQIPTNSNSEEQKIQFFSSLNTDMFAKLKLIYLIPKNN